MNPTDQAPEFPFDGVVADEDGAGVAAHSAGSSPAGGDYPAPPPGEQPWAGPGRAPTGRSRLQSAFPLDPAAGNRIGQTLKTWTVMECLSSARAGLPVLVIMGFSGSGKSTVAGILAGQLGSRTPGGQASCTVGSVVVGVELSDQLGTATGQ